MKAPILYLLLASVLLLVACGNAVETSTDVNSLPAQDSMVCTSEASQPHREQSSTSIYENYVYLYEVGRNRDWEEDIVYYANTLLTEHPLLSDTYYFSFDPNKGQATLVSENNLYDENLRQLFLEEIELLISRIPELDDAQISFELMRISALLGDAHTDVSNPYTEFFPVMVTQLEHEDSLGLYAVRLPAEYEALIYTRLISINGIPLDDIFVRLCTYISSENEYWSTAKAFDLQWGSRFVNKEALRIIDVLEDGDDTAEFTFMLEDGTTSAITLTAIEYDEYNKNNMVRADFYAQRIHLHENIDSSNYWYEVRPSDGILYVRISKCREHNSYAFDTFCREILVELESSDIPLRLVVDLRQNTGGSYPMSGFEYFVERLASVSTNGIYILIDGKVFSSGLGIAAYMHTNLSDAVLVGTPAGQPPNMFGNPKTYTTPNYQLPFRVCPEYWVFMEGYESDTLMPDILVYQTLEDYMNGADTVLEFALAHDTP